MIGIKGMTKGGKYKDIFRNIILCNLNQIPEILTNKT